MKYGLMVFITDIYPIMVALLAVFYGGKVLLRMAQDKPVVVIFSGKKVIVFCVLATVLVLVYLHLQLRWIVHGFENKAHLEAVWSLNEGAIWILVAWFLRSVSRQV
jgi:hypothetical protein